MLTPDHLPPHWPARTGLSLVELIRWPNAAFWLVDRVAVLPGRPPVLSWARSRPGQADTFQEGDSTQQVTKSNLASTRQAQAAADRFRISSKRFIICRFNLQREKTFCEGFETVLPGRQWNPCEMAKIRKILQETRKLHFTYISWSCLNLSEVFPVSPVSLVFPF